MKRDDSSPAAYLADVPAGQRAMVDRIRAVIREAAPGVREGIRHGMLDYPGLANLAAQKHHVSLYTNMKVVERFRGRLGKLSSTPSSHLIASRPPRPDCT